MKRVLFSLILLFIFITPSLTLGGECIEGDCENGQGKYTFSDGSIYEGEWMGNLPNGQGTLTSPDGNRYMGEFKDGEKHDQWTNKEIEDRKKEEDKSVCSMKDYEYADFWKNYYDPIEAYQFGLKIQELIRNKELQGLMALVDGELISGPRKNFAKDKRQEVLVFELALEKAQMVLGI